MYRNKFLLIGRRDRWVPDECEQASQVAEGCVQALQMNMQWVFRTLKYSTAPQVLDTGTGKLEFYKYSGN